MSTAENDIDANRTNGGDGIEAQAFGYECPECFRSYLDEMVVSGWLITDGYVYWRKECPVCKQKTMEVVRPGKVQCTEGCGR